MYLLGTVPCPTTFKEPDKKFPSLILLEMLSVEAPMISLLFNRVMPLTSNI